MSIRSLYLHYPFCRHLCNYCDFYKSIPKDKGSVLAFEETLTTMFEKHAALLERFDFQMDKLDTLFIGGGTPSLWGERGGEYLSEAFKRFGLSFNEGHEATLEVNPGSWTIEGLESFKNFGVNRFSLGIQSLNSGMLKTLDRVHNVDDVYQTLSFFSENNLNFSVDFMLGLPHSDKHQRDIKYEVSEILKFNPNHLSLYILTPGQGYVLKEDLPTADYTADEYSLISEYLQSKGYDHYEVSNFAKPGFQSKHNLEYWRYNSVAAVGPSATGYFSENGFRYRWKNYGSDFEEEQLNELEQKIEKLYMSLRIKDGMKILDVFEPDEYDQVHKIFQELINHGHAVFEDETYKLTSKGFLTLDGTAQKLLTYL